MYVRVDLAGGSPAVSLEEPDDCFRLRVVVEGGRDPAAADRALAAAGVGRLEDQDEAFVRVDALRRLAEGQVGEGWGKEFEAMVEHARSRGWFDPYDDAIRAHCDWAGES